MFQLGVTLVFCLGISHLKADVGAQWLIGARARVKCEPIKVDLCLYLEYNVTGMPNLLGHETQHEAEEQLRTFTPLVQYGCSPRLVFFLCSAYLPMCTEKVPRPIGPCRALCESVRLPCQEILNKFGFPWPVNLNCSKFPRRNDQETMCMEGPDADEEKGRPASLPPVTALHQKRWNSTTIKSPKVASCDLYRQPDKYVSLNSSDPRCGMLCQKDVAFTSGQKFFADVWMFVSSGLCFLFTLAAILTFLVDYDKFRYPDRIVVVIAFCYNVASVAFIIRLIAGRESVSCSRILDNPPTSVLVREGINNTDCTIVFLLLYYFLYASCLWWVIYSVLWFLSVRPGWSPDFIGHQSTVFHLVAWSVPAVLTIAILVPRSVDADELTGMCFVDHLDSTALVVIVSGCPVAICILVGFSFTISGFVARYVELRKTKRRIQMSERCRIEDIRHVGRELLKDSSDLPAQGVAYKHGCISLAYLFMFILIFACYCYEYGSHPKWYLTGHADVPNVELLIFKVALLLLPGVISGCLTLFSSSGWKTLSTCFCCRFRSNMTIKQPVEKSNMAANLPVETSNMTAKLPCKRRVDMTSSWSSSVKLTNNQASSLMLPRFDRYVDDVTDVNQLKSCHRNHHHHHHHYHIRYHSPDVSSCMSDDQAHPAEIIF